MESYEWDNHVITISYSALTILGAPLLYEELKIEYYT